MNKNELVEFSKRRLLAATGNPAWSTADLEIAASAAAALHLLAARVMADDAQRGLLQQDFTLTLNAQGRGLLTAATSAISGDLLPDGIYFGRVVDNDGNVLWPLKT